MGSFPVLHIRNYRLYLSLLLGLGFGLFVYAYWLVDAFPPFSEQATAYTVIFGLIGAAANFFLLELWVVPGLTRMSIWPRWALIVSSIAVGLALLLGGTTAWKSPSRYITFFLPRETLEVSVPAGQNAPASEVVIQKISSSVGEISYDELSYRGWKIDGSALVLTDLSDNQLKWTGPTGARAAIIFQKSMYDRTVNVSWNGESEAINLAADENQNYVYERGFPVPLHASRTMVLMLGLLNFFVISCGISLLVWKKRAALLDGLKQSVATSQALLEGRSRVTRDRSEVIRDWAIVGGIIVLATLLRVFNLGKASPYVDEYNHLLAAKSWLQDSPPLSILYQRSLWTVTFPVYLSLRFIGRFFGLELWVARLPGVIFNVLAIIPLYLATRKINRQVALLSCILYATSPWLIATSRTVREYGYYPFYFYWVAYFMILLIEKFPGHFVVLKDWRKIFRPEFGILTFALMLPVAYAFFDSLSTFKVILIAYGAFGLFLGSRLDLRNPGNVIILTAVGIFLGIGLFDFLIKAPSYLAPYFNFYALGYFLYDPQQQWYFHRPLMIPVFLLLSGLLMGYGIRRANFVPNFFSVIFVIFTLFFLVLFYHKTLPRYYLALELWFLVLMAVGLYGIWALLRTVLHKNSLKILALVTGVLLFFNPQQILWPTFVYQGGVDPVTEEPHDDVSQAQAFLLENARGQDVLISKLYRFYVAWEGAPKFKRIYNYKYDDKRSLEDVYLIVGKFDTGWIVIDNTRFNLAVQPPPEKTFTVGGKLVQYLGVLGGQHVYRWCGVNGSSQCD